MGIDYYRRMSRIEAISNSHNYCDYMKKNNNETRKATNIKNNVSFIDVLKEKINEASNK
ncbi:hypothetical protein [Clostridium sp. OS1-26]|uniref:hypothetical protein n=1 Tax=Clostridium sp. OS1-26 TaxID=3070681 RepID=UPI0027E171AD|nr:hypothetical protein [Clostridium sp. OS1-26]WML35231.1 hypothetical protein RCG18_00210 [Clostridium sp. OS1-26]